MLPVHLPDLRQKSFACSNHGLEKLVGFLVAPLVELLLLLIGGVRDVSHDPNAGSSGGGESKQRRCLHLHSENTLGGASLKQREGLAVGRIRCPDHAWDYSGAKLRYLLLKKTRDRRGRFYNVGRRKIVTGSSFIADSACGNHKTGQRQTGGDASCRGQRQDQCGAGGVELFGDEHGVRAADRPGDKTAFKPLGPD